MTTDPENLVLVYLRRMDAKLDKTLGEIAEIKLRLGRLEVGQARRKLSR